MTYLPSVFPGKITVEETQFTAAVSEFTMQKMGSAINAIMESLNFKKVEFTTPGSQPWVVPDTVTRIYYEAVGGGGGGGGGPVSSSLYGNGGAGCLRQTGFLTVTPGATVTIVIGNPGGGGNTSGGVGSRGSAGGNTSIDGIVVGPGAANGDFGFNQSAQTINNSTGFTRGGNVNAYAETFNLGLTSMATYWGPQSSESFPGGGTTGDNGGGASSYGPGGSPNGGNAAPTSYGAGGGGGNYSPPHPGGNGAGGYLAIYYQD